jgi:hypothetical protein
VGLLLTVFSGWKHFQRRIVSSAAALATVVPSGEAQSPRTRSSCPEKIIFAINLRLSDPGEKSYQEC